MQESSVIVAGQSPVASQAGNQFNFYPGIVSFSFSLSQSILL
jgi:hypothetical protein